VTFSNASKFLFRHAVAISVNYRLKDDPHDHPKRVVNYSATVMSVSDYVFLLTAGHCVLEIERILESDEYEYINSTIADIFGLEAVSDLPIPINLRHAARLAVDDEESGLDYGLIHLQTNQIRLLTKNGIVAIFEENWTRQHTIEFDRFFILGFPAELALPTISEEGTAQFAAARIGLDKADPPPGTKPTTFPRFVGKIAGDIPLNNIEGMSGGPIIGIDTRKPGVYWVVAIQSSWLKSEKIVFGCKIPVIGEQIKAGFDQLIDQSK